MNRNPNMTSRSVRLISDDDLIAMWRGRDNSLSPRATLLIAMEMHRRVEQQEEQR